MECDGRNDELAVDSEQNKEWNRNALEAWNEWKRICSIQGCCEGNHKAILNREIMAAFKRKFECVFACQPYITRQLMALARSKKKDFASDENLKKEEKDRIKIETGTPFYWASVFDVGIIEKTSLAKTKKNYKDFIWQRIEEERNKPPLLVIRGILTGNRGYINAIAEHYITSFMGCRWKQEKDPETGKKFFVVTDISLDSPLRDQDGNEMDRESLLCKRFQVSGPSFPRPCAHWDDVEDNRVIGEEVDRLLGDYRDKALLLAYMTRTAIYDCASSVGLGHAASYERLNKIKKSLRENLSEEGSDALHAYGAGKKLTRILIERLKQVPKAAEFLEIVRKETR